MTPRETINEAISSSEKFIAKCKGTEVETNYLAVFTETMMGVGYGVNGIAFTDTPYELRTAEYFAKNVTNGHGQHPVVMTHAEYLQKCIEQQEVYLETLRRLETQLH